MEPSTPNAHAHATADELLEALAADVVATFDAVRVPAYIVDRQLRVRWQNAASIDLFGDLRGRLAASTGIDRQGVTRAREALARQMNGAGHSELEVSAARRDGTRVRVAVSSVPLKDVDGRVIGSFGLGHVLGAVEPPSDAAPSLRPRERETLTLIAAGCSTAQMAAQMGIAQETVRNHVKRVLRTLGASSRVEAVAKARQLGLI